MWWWWWWGGGFNHSSPLPAPVSQGWGFRIQRTRLRDAKTAETEGDVSGDLSYFLHGRQNCKVLKFGSRKDLPGPQDQKCQIYFFLCFEFVLKVLFLLFLCYNSNELQHTTKRSKMKNERKEKSCQACFFHQLNCKKLVFYHLL